METVPKRNQLLVHKYNKHAHELPAIAISTEVIIQNNDRNKKWDRRGRVVEVLPNRQYRIRMLHSGRVTLQNRRFIREFTAIKPPINQMIPSGPSFMEQSLPEQPISDINIKSCRAGRQYESRHNSRRIKR